MHQKLYEAAKIKAAQDAEDAIQARKVKPGVTGMNRESIHFLIQERLMRRAQEEGRLAQEEWRQNQAGPSQSPVAAQGMEQPLAPMGAAPSVAHAPNPQTAPAQPATVSPQEAPAAGASIPGKGMAFKRPFSLFGDDENAIENAAREDAWRIVQAEREAEAADDTPPGYNKILWKASKEVAEKKRKEKRAATDEWLKTYFEQRQAEEQAQAQEPPAAPLNTPPNGSDENAQGMAQAGNESSQHNIPVLFDSFIQALQGSGALKGLAESVLSGFGKQLESMKNMEANGSVTGAGENQAQTSRLPEGGRVLAASGTSDVPFSSGAAQKQGDDEIYLSDIIHINETEADEETFRQSQLEKEQQLNDAAENYDMEAFKEAAEYFDAIGSDIYGTQEQRKLLRQMWEELENLDPNSEQHKRQQQDILYKYSQLYLQGSTDGENAVNLHNEAERWKIGDNLKGIKQLAAARDWFNAMSAQADRYPPEIQALIAQYANRAVVKNTKMNGLVVTNNPSEQTAIKEFFEYFNNDLEGIMYPWLRVEGGSIPERNYESFETDLIKMDMFGTAIQSRKLDSYHPQNGKTVISHEDWIACIKLFQHLDGQHRLKYGEHLKNADGTHTSMQYAGETLFADCYGLMAICARLILDEETYKKLANKNANLNMLTRKTSKIYENLEKAGKTWEVEFERDENGNSRLVFPEGKSVITLFVDNSKKYGYDHVVLLIKDYPMPDGPKDVAVQMADKDNNFKIEPIEDYLLTKKNETGEKDPDGFPTYNFSKYRLGDQFYLLETE